MIKIYKTKQEYEAIEMFKSLKDFKQLSFKFQDVEVSENLLALAQDVSLFGDRNFYFVPCLYEADLEILHKSLISLCAESEHVFLFWTKTILFKKYFESLGYVVEEKKEIFKNDFPAAFVTALQKKDKKNSWILFLKELETKNIEEVFGVMNFAYKQLLLAKSMKTFNEKSGMKEFQYKQAVSAIGTRTQKELEQQYFAFVCLYSESRRKNIPLDALVENFILSAV